MKIHLSNLPTWLGIPVPPSVAKIYDRRGIWFKEEYLGRLQHNTFIDTPLIGLTFQRHENLTKKNSVIITFILFLALFTAETLRFHISFVTSPLTKEAQSCSNSDPIVIFENLLSFLCNLWVVVCSMENLWVISTKKKWNQLKVPLWSNSRYPLFYIFGHNRFFLDFLPNFNLLRTLELAVLGPLFLRIYGRH